MNKLNMVVFVTLVFGMMAGAVLAMTPQDCFYKALDEGKCGSIIIADMMLEHGASLGEARALSGYDNMLHKCLEASP